MQLYSVYDKKALTYGPVMSFPMDVIAIRAIEMDINSQKSVMSSYPNDFCLVRLASFDENTGKLEVLDIPENVYECANALLRGEQK